MCELSRSTECTRVAVKGGDVEQSVLTAQRVEGKRYNKIMNFPPFRPYKQDSEDPALYIGDLHRLLVGPRGSLTPSRPGARWQCT